MRCLLSMTVHFIELRLGKAIMHQHTKILLNSVQMILIYHYFFVFFSDGNWPSCWIFTSVRFLPRDTLLSAVYAVVVCLSVCVCVCVCVSVTLQYCIKTAKRRITQITPHDSPLTLVFWQNSLRNSNGITPFGGDKCRWGG